jgi:hypothetical protein
MVKPFGENGFLVRRYNGGTEEVELFSDVVDGTSFAHGNQMAEPAFLDPLREKKLVTNGLRGFRSHEIASRLAGQADVNRIVWHSGSAWWQADTIFVDPRTCSVRGGPFPGGASETPNLYAMGAMLSSQFLDARSLGQAHRDATRLANTLFNSSAGGLNAARRL